MTENELRAVNKLKELLSELLSEMILIRARVNKLEEKINVIVSENVLKVKSEVNLESMDR